MHHQMQALRKHPPQRGWFLLLLPLLCLTAGCTPPLSAPPPSGLWHQQYEDLDSAELLAVAYRLQQAAVALAGPPAQPVKTLHLRRSRPRTERAALSRADLLDAQKLAQAILSNRPGWPALRQQLRPREVALLQQLAAGRPCPFAAEVALVAGLNRALRAPALHTAWTPGQPQGRRLLPWGRKALPVQSENRLCFDRLARGITLPMPPHRRVHTGIELCERLPRPDGAYVLYVRQGRGDPELFLELAHEVFHTQDARIFDWHMEGLCTRFAARAACAMERSWAPWRERFAQPRHDDAYALSYALVCDLEAAVGEAVYSLPRHTEPFGKEPERRRIDADDWLASLPGDQAAAARQAYRRWGPTLRPHHSRRCAFVAPQ